MRVEGTSALLLERARSGDDAARHGVIESNLQLAALLAWKIRPDGWHAVDAVQEANLILTQLVDDPTVDAPAVLLSDAIRDFFKSK